MTWIDVTDRVTIAVYTDDGAALGHARLGILHIHGAVGIAYLRLMLDAFAGRGSMAWHTTGHHVKHAGSSGGVCGAADA